MGSLSSNVAGESTISSELLEAQSHVWHHTMNFVTSMSLKCAVQLGIPDAVNSSVGGLPITLPDLVTALNIPPTKSPYIHRLLRVLVHSGFLISHIAGGAKSYSLTCAGKLLRKDSPYNGRAFVLMVLDPAMVEPYRFMSEWYQSEATGNAMPFSAAHGS
ncbi:Trans-resveratrol di-O-methyltransferase [Linum grandiflorum]